MQFIDDLRMYARFARGLPRFLRHPIGLEEAGETVSRLLRERESNFLHLARRAVYGNPSSPYREMLRMASCEWEDLERMVKSEGLEGTLRKLREAGVYVTFEEFKGRKPLIRNGREIPVGPRARAFDNPHLKKQYYSETGGSTGVGTRVGHDLDHLSVVAAHEMLTYEAHGVLKLPKAVWRGVLPDGSGIDNVLRTNRFGHGPERWFTPVMPGDLGGGHFKYKLATYFTVVVGRAVGASIPWPEPVHLDQAEIIARWAVDAIREHGGCLILAPVSRALRVGIAASELGLDLTGCVFRIAGESVTPAKVGGITATGARIFTSYGFSEAGRLAMGCANPVDHNDVHLLKGVCAAIQHPRRVPGSDFEVAAYNLTSLLPTTPRILLNAEIDDYGILETRRCGCPLGEMGLDQHLREIHSFCKLTGEGVTLVGSEMVHILEEVLPRRFGGSPLDYQLMEEEDDRGFTRVKLLIHPRVGDLDESSVVDTMLEALARGSVAAGGAKRIWSQAGTIRVSREPPQWTARGKLMTLYVSKRCAEAQGPSTSPR